MPLMPKIHRPLGWQTNADRYRQDRDRRGTRTEQGYTNVWARARRRYLDEHPLCVMCSTERRAVPANVVDHVIPHKGDPVLFWDESNWQSLCAPCHNGPKRLQENALRRASIVIVPRPPGRAGGRHRG